MNRKKGFTLIEMMVAMGVIAVISALSVFGIQQVLVAQSNTQMRRVLDNLDISLSTYLNTFGRLPSQVSFDAASGRIEYVDGATNTPTDIKINGNPEDFCYQRNASNPQLYVTAVQLPTIVDCKGTDASATSCTNSAGVTLVCGN